jgi:hypothetical protein
MRQQWPKFFLAGLCLLCASAAYSQADYHDEQLGVSLSVPPGWSWTEPKLLDTGKNLLTLRDTDGLQLRLWVQVLDPPEEPMPAQKMNKRLLKQAELKVEQRRREGYENYRLRKGSFELKAINGRSALSWVDDYTQGGDNMVEYLTRVRSEKTNAVLYARVPADQLDDVKARVIPIIETLQVQ